jgi:hypothetical protein
VIKPSTARALAYSFWGLRQGDLVNGLLGGLSEIEGSAALTADVTSCGCGVNPWGPALAVSTFVTRQTAFPAYFLAEGVAHIPATSVQGALVVLVFQRVSASTPWQVVIDSQTALLTVGRPDEDRPQDGRQGRSRT